MTDLLVVLIVILIVVLVWRGPRTLPRLGEALGRGVREARRQASQPVEPDEGREDADALSKGGEPPDGVRRR